MTKVRLLVGTKKGAFICNADAARRNWSISGPHFGGWEVYHAKASPFDPFRIYASVSNAWFGQTMQRSNDGGISWEVVSNQLDYVGDLGTHQFYDGTSRPFEFKRVWHLEPSHDDPDKVFAGVEDASLFTTDDGGSSWIEIPALRQHPSSSAWQPGAGGMCLHSVIIDKNNPLEMYIAISAAGAFRTLDGGSSWTPINKGLRSEYLPDEDAEVGHCVHHLARHDASPNVLFMQKHWDVMRSDNKGDSWYEISGNLPTDFGFVIDIHAHEPETLFVVPIKSDSEHFPLDGALKVFRSQTGGVEWEPLTKGLPQSNCYVNVLRDAMSVDQLDPCGIYFGTTGGTLHLSSDGGSSWDMLDADFPAILSVEAQVIP